MKLKKCLVNVCGRKLGAIALTFTVCVASSAAFADETNNVSYCVAVFDQNYRATGQTCTLRRNGEGDGTWTTTMTLPWGTARTFFFKNMTAETSIGNVGVYGEYDENAIYPSERIDVPNSLGGNDTYIALTRNDWNGFPTKSKSIFTVWVEGVYDDENPANNRFEYGSVAGYAMPMQRSVRQGTAIGTLPTLTRNSYEFLGWFTAPIGGTKISENYVIAEGMTFYAHWREIRQVLFDPNCTMDGCEGSMDNVTVDPGTEVEIPACAFVRAGRTFVGWALDPNGVVVYHVGDTVTIDEDMQLYAIWDGPPRFMTDEFGFLLDFELNGATEVHIPDTVKHIDSGMLDRIPDSLFDTNSIPCLKLLDGWVAGLTEDYWTTYETGDPDAPYWNLDLTGVRGVVQDVFGGYVRVSSLVVTQPILDYGVSAMFGPDVSSVTIADGATNILQHSLSSLPLLTNVTIAASVSHVAQYAFDGCDMLRFDTSTIRKLRLVDGWVVGVSDDYWNDLEPGEWRLNLTGARGIADFALGDAADRLVSVTIPNTIRNISEFAFENCYMLSSFEVLPGNARYSSVNGLLLESEGRTLVCVPPSMSFVKIPDGVTEIAPLAFYAGFQQNVNVLVPASVTAIDAYAFDNSCIERLVFEGNAPEVKGTDGCLVNPGIGMVYVTHGTTGWGDWFSGGDSWQGLPFDYKDAELYIEDGILWSVDMKGSFEIVIPSGVTRISESAFGSCTGLTGVKIPASVTHVDAGAFDVCSYNVFDRNTIPGLRIVDGWVVGLADDYWNFTEPWRVDLTGIRGIADYAFAGADLLVSVDMSKSVRIIGDCAFNGCINLSEVKIRDCVERIGGWAFVGCSEALFSAVNYDVRTVDGWVVGVKDYYSSYLDLRGVRGIAEHVFEGCRLQSVRIGDEVEYVGAHAFDGCDFEYDRTSSPGALIVDGWVVGFDENNYSSIRLEGVRGIADEAFAWNDSLSQVTIDNVRRIGSGAFKCCHNLNRVTIGKGVVSIGNNAFAACANTMYDTTTVPNVRIVDGWVVGFEESIGGVVDLAGVKGISDYAFEDCMSISGVMIHDGVTRIPRGAFLGCESLAEATIPDSVMAIGRNAFVGCNAELGDTTTVPGVRILDGWVVGTIAGARPTSNLVLPDIRGIADFAFKGCSELTNVTVPKSVVVIGGGAFSGCGALTDIVLPFVGARRGNSDMPDSLFGYIFGTEAYDGGVPEQYCGYGRIRFYIPASLKRVTITDETSLGYGAFSDCAGLESVTLNEGIVEITDSTFYGCASLADFTVPESVDWIGESAFYGCSSLRSFVFGANIAYLGGSIFGACERLDSVCFLGDAPYAESSAFSESSPRLTIYVSPESTGWLSGSSSDLPARWCGRRIKVGTNMSSGGNDGPAGGGAGVNGVVSGNIALTVTNIVIHYVTQSIPSTAVIPSTAAGIVNVISEVNAGPAVAVTAEWAKQYPEFEAKFGSDFAKALTTPTGKTDGSGKPMMVWQDFVAGTDPTDPEDVFKASITFDKETGEPVISWTPELPSAEAQKRSYKKYGKVRLTDADWTLIDGDTSAYNFFRVTVEMK